MRTLICRTCGCSLVRLGVSNEKANTYRYAGEEHYFCCQGCANLFLTDPQTYLEETSGLIVCPTCLAEKPRQWAAKLNIAGEERHFCRCPHCPEVFGKNPDFYIKRLEGAIANTGVLDHEGCCIRRA
jgi:YHS domain-containing protein